MLRCYRPTDSSSFSALFGDSEVMRYVGDGSAFDADSAALLFGKILEISKTDPSFFVWAIEENGAYVGHAELKRRAGREEYELIYILQRERWGRGLGGRVCDVLISEAQSRFMPFVIATVHPDNAPSSAILRRRGFVPDEALSQQLDCHAYRLDLARSKE